MCRPPRSSEDWLRSRMASGPSRPASEWIHALGLSDGDAARITGLRPERLRALMEMEVGTATGAGYCEKSPLRRAQRNGCRDRDCCGR